MTILPEMYLIHFLFNVCGEEIAIKAANNYRSIRKKKVTVRKTADIIIGTFCMGNVLLLMHNDRDFFLLGKYLVLKSVILKGVSIFNLLESRQVSKKSSRI